MKLLIILSVIACGYAAKLDRTYLPPASAATAGGSPGSLNTPVGPSGPSGPSGPQFGLPNNGAFGKTAGALNQPGSGPSSQYGQPVGPSFDAGFAQPSQNFGQAQNFGPAQNFGQAQNYQRNQPERAQAASDQNAEILRSDSQNDGETYSYNFETSNGIAVEESGVATNGVQAQGAFSYSDDDGQMFRVAYTADDNGFQPQGDHLPTPHPIPEEILKSIEQNARAAAAGTQEGAYNPEEDNDSFGPQQYSKNAPNSYNQGSAGPSGAYNQPQAKAPNALYGEPNAVSPSQGFQAQRPQGPSQQYGAPNSAVGPQSFKGPQQYNGPSAPARSQPSQQYGAPNGERPQSTQSLSQQYGTPSAGQSTPSFNQAQSNTPSALYGAPNGAPRPNSFNGNQPQGPSGANGFAASASAPSPSAFGPAQSIAQQYQAQPQSQGQFNRPQGSVQAQGESGYQYNTPQGSAFGRGNEPSNQQYRPQNGAGPSGSQGAFPKSNGAPQGSFGPARPNSFGAAASPNAAEPQGAFGPAGQGSFGSAGPSRPSFGSANQGPSQKSSESGYEYNQPGSQSSFPKLNGTPQGSFGPARPNSFGAAASPNAAGPKGAFGPAGQESFGPAGPSRPSFGSANQGPSQKSSESGYEYNQPGSQSFGPSGQGPRPGFPSASGSSQGQGQNFRGPQQAPSFTEEEGYKY